MGVRDFISNRILRRPKALVSENQMRRQRGTTSPGRNAAGFYNSGLYGGIDNSVPGWRSWSRSSSGRAIWRPSSACAAAITKSKPSCASIELPIEQGSVRRAPAAGGYRAEEQIISDSIEDAYLRRLDGGWEMAVTSIFDSSSNMGSACSKKPGRRTTGWCCQRACPTGRRSASPEREETTRAGCWR